LLFAEGERVATVETVVTRQQNLDTELTLKQMSEGLLPDLMYSFLLSTVEYFLNTLKEYMEVY
jgi:hypothetical protein